MDDERQMMNDERTLATGHWHDLTGVTLLLQR
jgi:hypothetical protein